MDQTHHNGQDQWEHTLVLPDKKVSRRNQAKLADHSKWTYVF